MRLSYLFIIVSAVLTSCEAYKVPNETRINNIPTPLSRNEVDVYFQGESPKEEYVKIKIIEVTLGMNADYNNLLRGVKESAREQGMDAVIILEKDEQRFTRPPARDYYADKARLEEAKTEKDKKYYEDIIKSNSRDGSYQSTIDGYTRLSALGLKYKRNLSYLKDHIKSLHLYQVINDDSLIEKALITYGYDNFESKVEEKGKGGQQYYFNNYKSFSADFLLKEKRNWYFSNSENLLTRYFYENQKLLVKCKIKSPFNLSTISSFEFIYINPTNQQRKRYILCIDRNDKKRIIGTRVLDFKTKALIETRDYLYRADSTTLAGYNINRYVNGRSLVTKAVYEYYTDADIAALK